MKRHRTDRRESEMDTDGGGEENHPATDCLSRRKKGKMTNI